MYYSGTFNLEKALKFVKLDFRRQFNVKSTSKFQSFILQVKKVLTIYISENLDVEKSTVPSESLIIGAHHRRDRISFGDC